MNIKVKLLLIAILSVFYSINAYSWRPIYSKIDSIKVIELLKKASNRPKGSNAKLYFARQLRGIPYVAKTLEKNKSENLVINLRELDCTTYIENVLALYLCDKHNKRTFADFCHYLRYIRYYDGNVAYASRLHYFSLWIESNSKNRYVSEIDGPNPPFTMIQNLRIDYMTKHYEKYPMLVKNPSWIPQITKLENTLNGRKFRYIPKSIIIDNHLFRKTIQDGDIIAIITNKDGLDTSHIGMAVWHKDGLHMLNASSIRHEVIEEPMTLYTYMKKHPSQIGIRIVKIL